MGDKRVRKPSEFRKESKLICPLRFHNPLPMVPSEQKLMAYPFPSDRFTKYSLTSLEAQYSTPLLLPLDLGINVDLVRPEVYAPPTHYMEMDDEDIPLLEEPEKMRGLAKNRKYRNTSSQYLRKSFLPAGPIVYSSNTKTQKKENPDVENEFDAETLVPKIQAGFDKQEFTHPTKPHLKVDKVYDVLPEFDFIHTEFVMVTYDEDPHEESEFVLLREHEDEEADPVLSLYTQNFQEEETQELSHLRNYKYTYSNDPNLNDVLLWFQEDPPTVTYACVENKLQLKKKKVPKGATTINKKNLPPKNLEINVRDDRKSELVARKEKLKETGAPIEEGLSSPVLENLPDDQETEKDEVNTMIKSLFGDISEEET
mmetsp:Transcript_13372/g.19523  ORF Transcript_13372/g.19523 Transcript_13372/m.19523 type:complete len:370 (+) Transcript_13372:1432-2541(+)